MLQHAAISRDFLETAHSGTGVKTQESRSSLPHRRIRSRKSSFQASFSPVFPFGVFSNTWLPPLTSPSKLRRMVWQILTILSTFQYWARCDWTVQRHPSCRPRFRVDEMKADDLDFLDPGAKNTCLEQQHQSGWDRRLNSTLFPRLTACLIACAAMIMMHLNLKRYRSSKMSWPRSRKMGGKQGPCDARHNIPRTCKRDRRDCEQ